MSINPKNLGNRVTTRTVSWESMVVKAWGGEWAAPDHGIYEFSNKRRFDSTDRGITGIYGIEGDHVLLLDGTQYPDMRDSLIIATGAGPTGAGNNGFGSAQELSQD